MSDGTPPGQQDTDQQNVTRDGHGSKISTSRGDASKAHTRRGDLSKNSRRSGAAG